MKRIATVLLSLVLLVGGGGATVWVLFSSGAFGFDKWVVDQVLRVAQQYLVPEITYEDFDYTDGVVTLTGITLTAPDGTEVVNAGTARVTLAAAPRFGRGITIERVELADSTLRLIAEEDGGFRGLVPFVKRDEILEQNRVDDDVKISNAFEIRRIALTNGALEFVPLGDKPPMRLTQINTELDVTPVEGATERVYELDLDIDRTPILALHTEGQFNMDDMTLSVRELGLEADLTEGEGIAALPPDIQAIVRQYEAHGNLSIAAGGDVALRDFMASTLNADVGLRGFNIAFGEYRLPIENAQVRMEMAERIATLPVARITGLGGGLTVNGGRLDLTDDERRAAASLVVEGMQLSEILRGRAQGEEEPRFAGIVNAAGSAEMSLASMPDSIVGDGTIQIREGRLTNTKLLKGLTDLAGSKKGDRKRAGRDRADLVFTLDGAGANFEEIEVLTNMMGVRGDGTLSYAGELDLVVNAGPLEKVQSMLGEFGGFIGSMTDTLVKYDVEGPAGDIQVKVRPLGIGE
ncbi:MAG: hypothetical protein AAFX05_07745 [Planctomycetota bacterium]